MDQRINNIGICRAAPWIEEKTEQALEFIELEGFEPDVVNESQADDEGVTKKQLLEQILAL